MGVHWQVLGWPLGSQGRVGSPWDALGTTLWLHGAPSGLTFMKSRIQSLLKATGSADLADSQQKDIIM